MIVCSIHKLNLVGGYTMDKIKGGLFGLLIGDALGVPYEFYKADELPSIEKIEFNPPDGFEKSYPDVPVGTWSDDGAQALCLLESLVECKSFVLEDFAEKLFDWYDTGRWAVDEIVFDVGMQTGKSLRCYKNGTSPEKSGNCRPDGKGNGALMRVLPLVLWHKGGEKALVADAHKQCLVTHGHICNQVCCALYCLVACYLLHGLNFANSYQKAVNRLRELYHGMPLYEQELEWSIRPDEELFGKGSGYVVDCLKSAFLVVKNSSSYEETVKRAVALGNDTDTTACVAGGLAGILYGFEGIPKRWIDGLRNKEAVENLLKRIYV